MKYTKTEAATVIAETKIDEPIVVIRGSDPFAGHLLRDYAARLQESARPDLAAKARDGADQVMAWQATNGTALPEAEGNKIGQKIGQSTDAAAPKQIFLKD